MTDNLLPFEKIKRETLIKKEYAPSSEYGCKPGERTAEEILNYGIINLDKPSGPTSHHATSYVKGILKIRKAGHSGTLDPKVVGILPVALGRATRITQLLLTAGKEYVGLMKLHKNVEAEKIRKAVEDFTGRIKQLPPVRSSVKRQIRERTVYYFQILETSGRDVLFRAGTQAGTYIRKLVSDLGGRIGGAHMTELRRTKAGPFNEKDGTLATLQDVADAYHYYREEGKDGQIRRVIQPVEKAVEHIPKVWITDSSVSSMCHGAQLHMPGVAKLETGIRKGDTVAVMTLKDELVAYGKAAADSKSMQKKEKGPAVKPEAVFMQPESYPKLKG